MRSVFKKIVEILDGTPADYGKKNRSRGQSVVELTLVTPILIVLLMGLAEIGWFANNFLILLEVTRVGARMGTVQNGDTGPLAWNNNASRADKPGWGDTPIEINGRDASDYRRCSAVRESLEVRGFYNLIACTMTGQMDPLVINPLNDRDDIVISAFSLMMVDPDAVRDADLFETAPSSTPINLLTPSLVPGLNDSPQVLVVGRYPTNANECTIDAAGNTRAWERDPFDYFTNGVRDYQLPPGGNPSDSDDYNWVEQEGYDRPVDRPYEPEGTDDPPADMHERHRGWSLYGNHYISEMADAAGAMPCIGSEWSIAEIEELMNGVGFGLRQAVSGQRQRLPSQGMVMVELFWEHELLLKNPVFNPVWTILGDRTTLSVWAAFPLPTTEPRITINEG